MADYQETTNSAGDVTKHWSGSDLSLWLSGNSRRNHASSWSDFNISPITMGTDVGPYNDRNPDSTLRMFDPQAGKDVAPSFWESNPIGELLSGRWDQALDHGDTVLNIPNKSTPIPWNEKFERTPIVYYDKLTNGASEPVDEKTINAKVSAWKESMQNMPAENRALMPSPLTDAETAT